MATDPNDKITRPEMKDALLRSGYLLESRVQSQLEKLWGYAEANPIYPDPETGKSREYDVFALSAYEVGPGEYDYIFGVLLIECVNNPQPMVILTKDPLVGFLHHQEAKVSGLPAKLQVENDWQQMSEYLGMSKYHHYCDGRVGTQFCSFTKKSGRQKEWMATHEDSHFDSFRKLCDVTEYLIDEHFGSWEFGERENLNLQFYYPVVVLQGDLIEARDTPRSVILRAADHLQFRRSVATKDGEINYQIDVIRERFLPKFLDIVDEEMKKSGRLLRRRHKIVRSAIDKIAANAKSATTREQIRDVMDYE